MSLEKKVGRPKFWTEEKIKVLGDDLIKWSKKDDSYALIQFCAEKMLIPSKIPDLAKENEKFHEALMCVKAILAARMIEKVNAKPSKIHPSFFNKYIRLNDYLLDQHLKELEKEIGKDLSNTIVKIINFSKKGKENEGSNSSI